MNFLAAQALPGPASILTCILQPYGPGGPTQYLVLEKETPLSQVPGLQYRVQKIANLPRLQTWDCQALTPATKASVKLLAKGNAVHDPTFPELADEVFEALDSRLYDLWKFCETKNVLSSNELNVAPTVLQKILENHELRPLVLKYLHWRRTATTGARRTKIRIFADEEEVEEMKQCHPRSIEILKRFLASIHGRSLFRALDVAGGDGRLCSSLLLKSWRRVDLFDQCPVAVKKA